MDFGTLLSVAQKNEKKSTVKACYQTKFAPPKKESRQSRVLSDNIKKFLARKEEEERQKAIEEHRKREELISLRDHKAKSRINKHLKVCKSANKAVIADAIDHDNTAVTLAGPAQCDEDDYGYVSQEASAYYNKLMCKYNSLPPEKSIFSKDGKKTAKDIASTKDRVRQALKQQEIEESLPHRRKRKHKESEHDSNSRDADETNDYSDKSRDRDHERDTEREEKPKIKKKPMPPPMDFSALLKLAEKKQYEPIKIEPKPKPKPEEPERLMTKRQMREYAKEKEWREKKEQRSREQQNPKSSENSSADSSKLQKTTIPKITSNGHKTTSDISTEKTASRPLPSISKKPVDKPVERSNGISKPSTHSNNQSRHVSKSNGEHRVTEKSQHPSKTGDRSNNTNRSAEKSNGMNRNSSSKVSTSEKEYIAAERRKLEEEKRKIEEMRRSLEEDRKKLMMSKGKKTDDSRPSQSSVQKPSGSKASINQSSNSKSSSSKPIPPNNVKSRPFPPADVKPRQFPPADVKPRQFPPPDVRSRQFPPPDVRSSKPKPGSSKLKVHKRRIYDEDDEEYDSELDDFIDDGPEEEGADYSKYISEIFGYDKSKYRHLDDDDDRAMESNFAQQLKEEFVSSKIGMLEDLEDIRQEALEKKRKKEFMKKKSKR